MLRRRLHPKASARDPPAAGVACGCYAGRRHASEEANARHVPVFSAAGHATILTPNEVSEVVDEAERKFERLGARAEYCKSHGVDYARAVRCVHDVRLLERSLVQSPSERPHPHQHDSNDDEFKKEGDDIPFVDDDVEGGGEGEGEGEGGGLIVHSTNSRYRHKTKRSPPPSEVVVEARPDGGIRIRVTGMSDATFDAMQRVDRCPLCRRRGHRLTLCPHMPDDLRPFC